MTELKTLKDIGFFTEVRNIPNVFKKSKEEAVFKAELKAEAIKWVKELRFHDDKRDLKRDDSIGEWGGYNLEGIELEQGYEQNDTDGILKFIKHFFNLTEEDLK